MLKLRISIRSASLRLPFRQALEKAAQLGAEAVEVDARTEVPPRALARTGVREIRKWLEDYNLRVCAVSFPTRRGYDVPEDLDRRVEATKDALQLAAKLGARVVVNYVGRLDRSRCELPLGPKSTRDDTTRPVDHVGHLPEHPGAPQWSQLVEVLGDLGRYGQHVGATLAARTGGESGADLARLVQALPTGMLGVDFDPGGLLANGFSAREALVALAPFVVHVHATDGVPDLAKGRGAETPLGRGAADIPELLGVLEQQGYAGYLTVECERAEQPVAEVGRAVQYLRTLDS
jgi:sugar phosphate isomerase/epimerase